MKQPDPLVVRLRRNSKLPRYDVSGLYRTETVETPYGTATRKTEVPLEPFTRRATTHLLGALTRHAGHRVSVELDNRTAAPSSSVLLRQLVEDQFGAHAGTAPEILGLVRRHPHLFPREWIPALKGAAEDTGLLFELIDASRDLSARGLAVPKDPAVLVARYAGLDERAMRSLAVPATRRNTFLGAVLAAARVSIKSRTASKSGPFAGVFRPEVLRPELMTEMTRLMEHIRDAAAVHRLGFHRGTVRQQLRLGKNLTPAAVKSLANDDDGRFARLLVRYFSRRSKNPRMLDADDLDLLARWPSVMHTLAQSAQRQQARTQAKRRRPDLVVRSRRSAKMLLRKRLGQEFERLAFVPGIASRLKQFLEFAAKRLEQEQMTPEKLHQAFGQHLGHKSVWRGMALTPGEAARFAREGAAIDSNALRTAGVTPDQATRSFEQVDLSDLIRKHVSCQQQRSPLISVTSYPRMAETKARTAALDCPGTKPYVFALEVPRINLIEKSPYEDLAVLSIHRGRDAQPPREVSSHYELFTREEQD